MYNQVSGAVCNTRQQHLPQQQVAHREQDRERERMKKRTSKSCFFCSSARAARAVRAICILRLGGVVCE